MVKESPSRNRKSSAPRALTPREREILHWIAEGKRDSEIAAILNLSVERGIGTEDVVDDDDVGPVHHADPHRRLRSRVEEQKR